MRAIMVVVLCVMAALGGVGVWALESWDATSDPRFLRYMAWDILVGIAFFGILRLSEYTAMGVAGVRALRENDVDASRPRSSNVVDLDAIRATLARCENTTCPTWVTSEVAMWLEDGPNDAVRRRALLERLYRYSAFSNDAYERRRAANDLRVAIKPLVSISVIICYVRA